MNSQNEVSRLESDYRNIYIADDIQENIQVLGKILMEKGFNIQVARNGKQLLNGVKKTKADLILLDISMPEMDGYETCERLKADESTRDIPVIFLTAKTDRDDIIKGFQTGGVDYITKPFHADELLARVNTHLELKLARDTVLRQNKELEKKNTELYTLSVTDPLTGISNRLFIMDALKKEFSRAKRHSVDLSCLIFDIDLFKNINDSFGHQAGDFVLKEMASRVKSTIRHEDFFGRYGGEEFLVLFPSIGIDEAFLAGEKIREIIGKEPYKTERSSVPVTISLGLSSFKSSAPKNREELLSFADIALYRAKEQGRNRSVIYHG